MTDSPDPPESPAYERRPDYEHRQMRVKTDRTLRIAGRRYRPGEAIEGEIPEQHLDDCEMGVVALTPPPLDPPGPRVRKERAAPGTVRRLFDASTPVGLDKLKTEEEE